MVRCHYVHKRTGERCIMSTKPHRTSGTTKKGQPKQVRDGYAHKGADQHRIRYKGRVYKCKDEDMEDTEIAEESDATT